MDSQLADTCSNSCHSPEDINQKAKDADMDIFILLAIMLSAGVLGGLINFFLNDETSDGKHTVWHHIIFGVGAAFLVPLFLNMISSTLIEGIVRPTANATTSKEVLILVFMGFCLIAAISSKAFIKSISERVLQKASEAQKVATQLQQDMTPILQRADEDTDDLISDSSESSPLSTGQIIVLNALNHERYTYRTLSGVVKASSLDKIQVQNLLLSLAKLGMSGEVDRGKGPRYYITNLGVTSLNSQDSAPQPLIAKASITQKETIVKSAEAS